MTSPGPTLLVWRACSAVSDEAVDGVEENHTIIEYYVVYYAAHATTRREHTRVWGVVITSSLSKCPSIRRHDVRHVGQRHARPTMQRGEGKRKFAAEQRSGQERRGALGAKRRVEESASPRLTFVDNRAHMIWDGDFVFSVGRCFILFHSPPLPCGV